MLESAVEWALPMVISLCEFMGIFIVAVSALGSFGRYLKSLFTHAPCDIKFQLANGLALSLEFKMAAEILVRELNELVVLGAVIILRALLSFLIHFEMKQPHSS